MQKFLKVDIYSEYYKICLEEKKTAKSISDFGLCFFDTVERLKMWFHLFLTLELRQLK